MNNDNKRQKGFFERCPLVVMIVFSGLILTIIGLAGMISGKFENNWSWEHPALESVLLGGQKEDELDESEPVTQPSESQTPVVIPSTEQTTEATSASADTSASQTETQIIVPTLPSESESNTSEQISESVSQGGRIPRPMNYVSRPACEIRSEYYDDPQMTPRNKDYNYVYGDDAYFEDALFIGDSRIQGIYYYSGIPATYAYLEGVSLFKCKTMSFTLSTTNESLLLSDIFAKRQYKKIYLLFGLNELGDHTSQEYGDYYDNVVNWIKNQQPDAIITIMESTPLSTYKSDNSAISEWRNNDNINSRNYWAAKLACDGKDVFYLDFYIPEFLDEVGGLSDSCSNDGIHLLADRYNVWTEYIRSHCLGSEMWE